jgi:hypothetical protein
MDDVVLGLGGLAGRGVYAARDFDAGEVVMSFWLRPLDADEYAALPAGEDLFVHSYGGRRFLYPAPARFVNHSDDPSCVQDFDRRRHIALRPIATGEPVTIDATQETARELDTFLDAYRHALGSGSVAKVGALVDGEATLWLDGQALRGRDAVVAALLDSEPGPLSGVEWVVGTGRWEALCSAETPSTDGRRRHLTMLLKVVDGNWQTLYQHIG